MLAISPVDENLTTARRIGECATGIEPPLIGIAGIRDRLAVHGSGNKNRRIRFDKARQVRALCADISDLEQPIGPERLLQVQVPILRVRECQRRRQSQVREWRGKRPYGRRMAVERIREVRQAHLWRSEERRRADRRLQWTALSGVIRLIEDTVCRSDQQLAITVRVPRDAKARRECLHIGWDQACGHTGIARI